ncbi:LINE-1 reverse transcriptase homolog, partial [Linum grandiflorum]
RLASVLPRLISPSQSAFAKGRLISDNILLAQELVASYHSGRVSPRCVMKVDIMKAFDSLSWEFLFRVLKAMCLPACFIGWIRVCLETASLSVSINGGLCGFFKARRGLRQGDPLSPLLFVIGMEVLHCLASRVAAAGYIPFHPRCNKLGIVHLCFADDLMMFTNGTVHGVRQLKHLLGTFRSISGLGINPSKSTLFCSASVPAGIRKDMQDELGFSIGELPVRYLGVPLVSGRLKAVDCKSLIDRITSRIWGWRSHLLSHSAGGGCLFPFCLESRRGGA